MRLYRHTGIKQAGKGGPRPGGYWREYASLQGFSETQQGGRSTCVRDPENANLLRSGRLKDPFPAHQRGCQVSSGKGGNRELSPADELGRSRQLVFIADLAGIATEEVEVDKDRVVWTVGLHVQGQQGKGYQGEGRAGRQVGVPHVSHDLAGDSLVMTGGAVKHQSAIGIGRNGSAICQRRIRLDRDC